MKINIRQEIKSDYQSTINVVKQAFQMEPYSDQSEHHLVKRLRNSIFFIPELSLVAEVNGELVGHIILSKIKIKNEKCEIESLALAPVSVLPKFQKKGIGTQLILEVHKIAQSLGFQSIVLIGHAAYYPRFGYRVAADFSITFPFEIPKENGMVIALKEGILAEINGMVIYPDVFFK
jgi:predicted N-acetyltransferase YhbS